MRLNECRIDNMPAMVKEQICHTTKWVFGHRNEKITITVAHRLAHLIFRIETNPRRATAAGAKWFLQNIERINHEQPVWKVLQPFISRLQDNIGRYEQDNGVVDTSAFDSLVKFAGVPPERILYGLEITYITGPCFGEPLRNLCRYITYDMWRQTIWD